MDAWKIVLLIVGWFANTLYLAGKDFDVSAWFEGNQPISHAKRAENTNDSFWKTSHHYPGVVEESHESKIINSHYGDLHNVANEKRNEDERGVLIKYQEAAIQGNITAQSRLGIAYLQGELGLPKNNDKAEQWLTEAAINNNVSAQYYLGRLLLKDRETNRVDALVWIGVAAKRGYEPAQYTLRQYWKMLQSDEKNELISRIGRWHIQAHTSST